jgi:pimeloyl-ACP methyl ester carboxylesterase
MLPVRTWTISRGVVDVVVHEYGDPAGPAAVVAHGVGSTADFVTRAFGPALAAAGYRLVAPDLRGHGASTPLPDTADHSMDAHVEDLTALVDRVSAALVGGVSLGAHVAALVAARRAVDGLLLALPGWLGQPDATAAANAGWAAELEHAGVPATLRRISRQPGVPGWVAEEIGAAWSRHDPASLVAALRAVAVAPAPTPAQLADVTAPAGVVATTDDPAHPLAAASAYADGLPRAVLLTCRLADLGVDRSRLGELAMAAVTAARVSAPR